MGRIQLKVEEVGAPTEVSPEVRYAQLHRDLDRGLDSERSWASLCEVCLRLGKIGEAAQTLRHIYTPAEALRLTRLLEQHGVILHDSAAGTVPETPASAPPQPRLAAETVGSRAPSAPAAAAAVAPRPAAPAAPPRVTARGFGIVEKETVGEECTDALGYLLRDHMPVTAMGLTVLFPFAAALGLLIPAGLGDVTTGLLRSLPTLAVLGIALHFMRRVLLEAAQGQEDPSPVAELLQGMTRGAPRALGSIVVLLAVCFGPASVGLLAELPWQETLVLALVGAAYLPCALIGLALRGSWEAILPGNVLRAVAAEPGGFVRLAGVAVLCLALPVATASMTAGGVLYLQAALIGPLIVGPGIVLARVLGRYYYAHTAELSRAFGLAVDPRALMTPDQVEQARRLSKRRAVPDRKPAPRIQRRPAQPGISRSAARRPEAGRARQVQANPPAPRRRPGADGNGVPQPALRVGAVQPGAKAASASRAAVKPVPAEAPAAARPRRRPMPKPVARAQTKGGGVVGVFDPTSPSAKRLGNHSHTPLRQ